MARRGGRMIGLAALAALALSGCVSAPREGFAPMPAAAAPVFDPLVFFAGTSTGRGQFSKVFSASVPVRVESRGEMVAEGVLRVAQVVHEGDKPARERSWEIRRAGEGPQGPLYEGTLSDATGPVSGVVEGNVLTLRFPIKDGFEVTQRLTLAPDGRSAFNTLKVTMMGLTVAVLAEEIVRE